MGRGKLGIISDTAVTKTEAGDWLGYEPVVKEIDYFLQHWDEVNWLAYQYSSEKTIYSRPLPLTVNVKAISPLGGAGWRSKLNIVTQYLSLILDVYRVIKASNEIHVRAPSYPAICAMILTPFFRKKTFWFKYAGSWIDEAPLSYNIQRKLLKRISRNNIFTTVNGRWPDSPKNILPFENPCFSEAEYKLTFKPETSINKSENTGLHLTYVGSLSEFKGVQLVINALEKLNFNGFSKFTIVGTGEYEKTLRALTKESPFKERFFFEGKRNKEEVFRILEESDLLVIASVTEGFPKVISEAMMNYCIPISTRVSCIDQYVDESIGFMIEERSVEGVAKALSQAVNDPGLRDKRQKARALAAKFTYENYLNHLLETVFRNKKNYNNQSI